MFLVRSTFWLCAAFLMMAPTVGMDVGEAARSTGEQLVNRGAQTVTETLLPETCGTMECTVGRAVVSHAADTVRTAQAPSASLGIANQNSPFPPPRPAWAY